MAKKYGHIWRTHQKAPQTNYRKDLMLTKRNDNLAILANFGLTSYDGDEARHIPTKNFKFNPFVVELVLEPNCKHFRNTARQKRQTKIRRTVEKKLSLKKNQLRWAIQWSERKAVSQFLYYCLKMTWAAAGPKHVCFLKCSRFVHSSQAKNTLPARAVPPRT